MQIKDILKGLLFCCYYFFFLAVLSAYTPPAPRAIDCPPAIEVQQPAPHAEKKKGAAWA